MDIDPLIIAETFKVTGDIIIALVVLSVHMHIFKERKIDSEVIKSMRREQAYVLLGIFFLIAGYAIEVMVRI